MSNFLLTIMFIVGLTAAELTGDGSDLVNPPGRIEQLIGAKVFGTFIRCIYESEPYKDNNNIVISCELDDGCCKQGCCSSSSVAKSSDDDSDEVYQNGGIGRLVDAEVEEMGDKSCYMGAGGYTAPSATVNAGSNYAREDYAYGGSSSGGSSNNQSGGGSSSTPGVTKPRMDQSCYLGPP